MNIGIDIDGVLTNDDDYILDFTSKYCYEHDLKGFDNANLYEYRKLNWDENTINDYRKEYFLNYIKNEPARKFASEVIKKLRYEENKIFIISARYKTAEYGKINNENVRECTLDWLRKNKIEYDKIIFTKPPKVNEILENKIDIMIEDSPTTINELVKVVKVLYYDTRYNRSIEHENITRVYSWYDIYMKINEMKEF
jgi:uncharacterized HAD superfamily protein